MRIFIKSGKVCLTKVKGKYEGHYIFEIEDRGNLISVGDTIVFDIPPQEIKDVAHIKK